MGNDPEETKRNESKQLITNEKRDRLGDDKRGVRVSLSIPFTHTQARSRITYFLFMPKETTFLITWKQIFFIFIWSCLLARPSHRRQQLINELLFDSFFQAWVHVTIQRRRNAPRSRRPSWVRRRTFCTISIAPRRSWKWSWRSRWRRSWRCRTATRTWTRIRRLRSTTTSGRRSAAAVPHFSRSESDR